MQNIKKITKIFNLYYTDKITREERLTMLKNTISIEDFNEAILLLEDGKSLEDVQNVILTGWLLNCFNPSSAKYLEPEDFKYPYIRKIIYAIGAQPQPESLLALEKLASETDDEKIKELALHQLEKRK